jgi:hypothetical protein
MTDRTRLLLEIGGGLLLLVLVLFVVFDQYRKAVDNASAMAEVKVQQAADKKLDETLSARDKQHNEDLKEWADKFASLKQMTPQQIVVKAPRVCTGVAGEASYRDRGPRDAAGEGWRRHRAAAGHQAIGGSDTRWAAVQENGFAEGSSRLVLTGRASTKHRRKQQRIGRGRRKAVPG